MPTVIVPGPTQVEDIVQKIMLTANKMRDDDYGFPETISRKNIMQAAGYYELQTECLRGHTWLGFDEGYPDDWGAKRRGRWARSAL